MTRIPRRIEKPLQNVLDVQDLLAREEAFRDREEQHDKEKEQGSTSFGPRAISPYPHTGD